MKPTLKVFGMLLILIVFSGSCRRVPDANQSIGASPVVSKESLEEQLKLRPGLKIILAQNLPNLQSSTPILLPGVRRQMEIQTPLTSEGLSFQWSLRVESQPAGGASPESAPSAGGAAPQVLREEGSMTLANVVGARSMTLPLFWPQGELYLSNSSALWISDRALDDLKKNKKSNWSLGLLGNGLAGAIPGMAILEKSLENLMASLQKNPEMAGALPQIEVWDKSSRFTVKINGQDRELDTIVAGNWLAEYTILNQAQNPLILQVRLLPKSNPGDILFSPLAWIKPFLDYRVEEIEAPVPVIRISPAF